MIEYGGQLVVDGSQVGRGVRLSVLVPVLDQLVLPTNHIYRLDFVHSHVAEERSTLVVDDVLFVDPAVLPDARLDLGGIHIHEVPEGHVHGA